MKRLIRLFSWLKQSNRDKHLLGGLVIGLTTWSVYCAAYAGLAVASALEFKDKSWGGKWDWMDWSLTVAGVIAGQIILQLTYYCLAKQINWF